MHINIKDDDAHRMARELARLTGESMTEAVTTAIAERLERQRKQTIKTRRGVGDKLRALADECARLPMLDDRDADAILYDEHGLLK